MRKPEKSIIKAIVPIPDIVNDHLNSLNMGYRTIRGRTKYINIETGDEFYYIAGGIAWPGAEAPGYVLIVGVKVEMENNKEVPVLVCLEEIEERQPETLLAQCVRLREKYGHQYGLFQYWYGDYERLQSLVVRFNQQLQDETNRAQWVCISTPADFQKNNHFEIYRDEIWSLLKQRESGAKTLVLADCDRLRNAIHNFPSGTKQRFSDDDCPPVACLGYVIHSLLVSMPWRGSGSVPGSDIGSWEEYARKESAFWQGRPFGQNVTDCI